MQDVETDNLDIAVALGNADTEGIEVWNMSFYDQFTSLEGRINRLRYLTLSILTLIGSFVYAIIIALLTFWMPEPFWTILLTILFLPIYYITYALNVKRLQDSGRGDGWISYAQIAIVLSIIYSMTPLDSDIEFFMAIISGFVSLPLGIVCLFFRGDTGPNQFGPDPLG